MREAVLAAYGRGGGAAGCVGLYMAGEEPAIRM